MHAGRSKGSVGPLYADFLTNTEVLVFDGVARPQGWTQYSSFHRHAPPPTQTPSQDAPAPLLTQKPSQGAPGPSQQHVHVQPVAPAAELNSQHSRPQAQQQPQGNVKGQGHQREASQTHDKVQGQDQTKAEHSKAQGQEQQQGPLKEVPQAQGQGNSRQLVHSGSKGQAQKPGKNHAEGQPPSKSQKLGHAPGQKTSQAQTQKQEQGPVSAVPGSRGQKRPASAPPASSGDVPQPKRAKPTAQA